MNVPMGLSEGSKLVYAYATYIFMNVIVYTIYGIANTALLPLMTRDRDESTMLATFSAIGNNGIGLLAGTAITPLVLDFGWTVSSVVLGGVACALILFSGLLNKEVDSSVQGGHAVESVPMKEQLSAVLKNQYFWLLLLIGVFSLLMNANAIGGQIFFCNVVLHNPMFMTVLMTAGQFSGEEGQNFDGSCEVKACVDQFGPIDFRTMDGQVRANGVSYADHDEPHSAESSYMGGPLPTLSDEWLNKANPTAYINDAMAPMLVEHGCMDKLVPFAQSANFVNAIYQKLGPGRVEFVPLPNADHEDKEYSGEWNMNVLWGWLDKHL